MPATHYGKAIVYDSNALKSIAQRYKHGKRSKILPFELIRSVREHGLNRKVARSRQAEWHQQIKLGNYTTGDEFGSELDLPL